MELLLLLLLPLVELDGGGHGTGELLPSARLQHVSALRQHQQRGRGAVLHLQLLHLLVLLMVLDHRRRRGRHRGGVECQGLGRRRGLAHVLIGRRGRPRRLDDRGSVL